MSYMYIIVAMYIDIVPNRNSRPAILLREGWREGNKIRKRTLANLTEWPEEKIEALRRVLSDQPVMAVDDVLEFVENRPHGHVEAILGTIKNIGLDVFIDSKRSRERDLVLAMIAEQIIHASSKLGSIRLWRTTTLAEELGVADADEDDLYAAMDWLVQRQSRIEKKLASRHLTEGIQVLYDVTSSYYEGKTCPLALFGYSRDGKKGKPIIVYGVLTDPEGRPVAVDVYPGNTADPTTVPDQVQKLRERFGLQQVVLVGDRGMLTSTQIEAIQNYPGLGWISSLRSKAIRKLVDTECLQPSLFDEQNLAEISSAEFPGERLIACYNPLLAEERQRKRQVLLKATQADLDKIVREVARRTKTPLGKAEIGKKVGKVLHHYKMGKHFELMIEDSTFHYARREDTIRRESELDGIYVIRTSEPLERLSAEDAVRSYKRLTLIEQAFRCLKGIDLLVRPIRHRDAQRVRAHIFLCMLAYYVQWHMRKALAPLLFIDEELDDHRAKRDPVAPAKPSPSARKKKTVQLTPDGQPIHSFDTLLAELGTRCRNKCQLKTDRSAPTFDKLTEPNSIQKQALQLLGLFPVKGSSS
jgi:transposase